MALRICPHCAKSYSDSVLVCPHCQFEPQIILCPECDMLCSIGEKSCHACGYDLTSTTFILAPKERVKEMYDRLLTSLNSASSENDYASLEHDFVLLGNYEDAAKQAAFCKAMHLSVKAKTAEEFKAVSTLFSDSGDEANSLKYKEMFLDLKYKEALSMMNTAVSKDDWIAALNCFTSCGDYKESNTRASICKKNLLSLNHRHTGKIIGWVSTSVLAIVAIIVFFTIVLPSIKYSKAMELFDNGEYLSAETIFLSLGDRKDSEEKAVESVQANNYSQAESLFQQEDYVAAADDYAASNGYKDSDEKIFECGIKLVQSKEYDDAITVLTLSEAAGTSDYLNYAKAMIEFNSKDYASAIDYFKKVSDNDIEDCSDKTHEAYYRYGKQLLSQSNYDSAKTQFSRAGDYSDASDMINACTLMDAESYMDKGYLNTALSLFESLPDDFEYNGISVSDRLDTLDEYSEYLPLCGKWRASGTQSYHTKQISKSYGSWSAWDGEWEDPYQYISVTCRINDDGTVDVIGSAEYYCYTNYSSISIGLDFAEKTARIDRTVSSPLDDWYYVNSNDDYCTIKFSNGAYKLNYYNYSANESVHFDYVYGSDYYYGNQIEVY